MEEPKLTTLKKGKILIQFPTGYIGLIRRNGKKFEKVLIDPEDLIRKYSIVLWDKIFEDYTKANLN